jgi:hypothetical protein
MGQHIKSYLEVVNESIGRGSVVFIKGKSEKGKKRLYAAHLISSTALPTGGVMLFLSDEFYRIKEEEGQLKAVKIGYRSEDDLKSALNLKSPGKISIVKNNNKTPLHWKTLKHTSIQAALNELEDDLKQADYLFESVSQKNKEDLLWEEFINLVFSKTVNTLFFGKDEIDILRYRIEDVYQNIWESDESNIEVEWSLDTFVLLKDKIFKPYLEPLGLVKKSIEVSFFFTSDVSMDIRYDRGDYWTPPSSDASIDSVDTRLDLVTVDGSEPTSPQSRELELQVKKIVSKGEMLPDELEKFILSNLSSQSFIRREK